VVDFSSAVASLGIAVKTVAAWGGGASAIGISGAAAVGYTVGLVPASASLLRWARRPIVQGAHNLELVFAHLELLPLVNVALKLSSGGGELDHVVAPVDLVVRTARVLNLVVDEFGPDILDGGLSLTDGGFDGLLHFDNLFMPVLLNNFFNIAHVHV
jgi:hypothetical protein